MGKNGSNFNYVLSYDHDNTSKLQQNRTTQAIDIQN